MRGVVGVDQGERGDGVGDRIYPDIVALEGFHEGLRHAVALRAFDGSEAGFEIER